jgi:hypothetical protein
LGRAGGEQAGREGKSGKISDFLANPRFLALPRGFWGLPKVFWDIPKVFRETPKRFWDIPKVFWGTPEVFRETPKGVWETPKGSWGTPKVSWGIPKRFRETPKGARESPKVVRESPGADGSLRFGSGFCGLKNSCRKVLSGGSGGATVALSVALGGQFLLNKQWHWRESL